MTWVTAYSMPLPWFAGDSQGNGGSSHRAICQLSHGGTKLKIFIAGGYAHNVTYDHIAVGKQQSGANTVATPVAVAGPVTALQGATLELPPVDFATQAGDILVVVGDLNASSSYAPLKVDTGTNNTYQKTSTASYNQASVSGFATSDYRWVVRQIDVWQEDGQEPPPEDPPAPTTQASWPARVLWPLPRRAPVDLLGGTVPSIPANDPYATGYSTMLQSFLHVEQSLALSKSNSYFFGDSLTQCLNVSRIAPHAVNFGVGGATTANVLNLMGQFPSMRDGDTMFLMGPWNDFHFGKSFGEITGNLQKIFDWRTGRFVFVPTLDIIGENSALIASVNAWAVSYLTGKPNVAIADVSGFDRATMTIIGDGHLNGVGDAFTEDAARDAFALLQ